MDSIHHQKKMLTCKFVRNFWKKCAHGENSTIHLFQSLTIRKYKEILTQGQLFYSKWISLIFCEAHLVPLNMATMGPTIFKKLPKQSFLLKPLHMIKLLFTTFVSCKWTLRSYSQDAKVVNENFIMCNGG